MKRVMPLVLCMLTGALLAVPTIADDLTKKLSPEKRKELEARWHINVLKGIAAHGAQKLPEAIHSFEAALVVARQLYVTHEYPDGHANLADSLNVLATVYMAQGNLADAEPLAREALQMVQAGLQGRQLQSLRRLEQSREPLPSAGKLD